MTFPRLLATATAVAFALHPAPTLADSIVTDWNTAALTAVRATRFAPPQTARALAIVHTCIYDAWAAYDGKANGTQYFGSLRRPVLERTEENKETAISFAAYRALVDLFPTQTAIFNAVLTAQGLDAANTSTDITTPTGIGNVVAAAVLSERHYDGSNQLGELRAGAYTDYTGYAPVNTVAAILNPNRWQPLVFTTATGTATPGFLVPHWQNVKPFALTFAGQFRPIPPLRFPRDAADYTAQAQNIVRLTSRLNDRKKAISEYWSDGPASETPPGHWQLHAQFVSLRDGYGLNEDARLFFALGNAMLDASIATWEAKRFYDSQRPITSIRFLFAGKVIPTWGGTPEDPATVQGELWKPYQLDSFLTPPFAEHTSGHSAFSAAAAFVLQRFTGSDFFGHGATVAAGSSRVQPGQPARDVRLTWATFTEAANQAGLSRRYGGIHFIRGDLAGRKLGADVGLAVWKKCVQSFEGNSRQSAD